MRSFCAMSTEVTVHAAPDVVDEAAARAAALFDQVERRFSRFRPDSELSLLNRTHEPVRVSRELFDALARARAYHEATDGLFDPAVGGVLRALGYARPFAPGVLDDAEPAEAPSGAAGSISELALDRRTLTVTRPPHLHLDLGGMMKGHTVDRAAMQLGDYGAIDAGGDIRVRGLGAAGDEWLVDVEDPSDRTRTVATLALRDAAIATSADNRRAWRTHQGRAHHLIDPRTGRCAASDLRQVSVVAPEAELADVLAKTAFLAGARDAVSVLARWSNVGAVLVEQSGRVRFIGGVDIREQGHA